MGLDNPSCNRLVAFENDRVSFLWRDYAHGGKKKIVTVSADEFLRRFLLHVLPKGLVRIRHFGFFANRRRKTAIARHHAGHRTDHERSTLFPARPEHPYPTEVHH
jgi:hypothetical protein